MSIITTIAAPDAESYVSVAECDDYLAGRASFDTAGWAALDELQKEFQLKLGARIIDSLSFRGVKATRNQALAFPRIFPNEVLYVEDEYGVALPFNDWDSLLDYADLKGCGIPFIPVEVQFAQIEVTFQVVYSHLMTLGPMETGERSINSLSIDVISLSFGDKGKSVYDLFAQDQFGAIATVRLYLRKYLGTSGYLL
jgi:hypothetical protein